MKRSAFFGAAAAAALALAPTSLRAQSAESKASKERVVTITLGHRPAPADLPAEFSLFDNTFQRFIFVKARRHKALENGDIIRSFAGASVTTVKELEKRIRETGAGEEADFTLIRKARSVRVRLRLDREPGPAYLGLKLTDQQGFTSVRSLEARGSAALAKLQKGDVILGLDRKAISGKGGLEKLLASKKSGETITLGLLRSGVLESKQVKLLPKPTPGFIGIKAQVVNGLSKITDIIPGTAAAKLGLEPGQTVVGFEGKPLSPNRTLIQALASTRPGQTVRLTIREP